MSFDLDMYKTSKEFTNTSVCVVSEPDYSGQVRLLRLADIAPDGRIERFEADDYRPKNFDNRSFLFHQNGISQEGRVGVWEWNAKPNLNNPEKDFITSAFIPKRVPTEIYILSISNIHRLVDELKEGIRFRITSPGTIFAIKSNRNQYEGVYCDEGELEEVEGKVKIKRDVSRLPIYDLTSDEIMVLGNNRYYYRNIDLKGPGREILVKDPMDIVGEVFFNQLSWADFKQAGKTRSEWKAFREFLSLMNKGDLQEKVETACLCTEAEAKEYIDRFIEKADAYIDGKSIEDQIIISLLDVNKDLAERFEDAAEENWKREHKDTVEALEKELSEKERQLSSVNSEWEKYVKEIEAKQEKLKEDNKALSARKQELLQEIEEKEQLARNVETEVADRIRDAQENAARFIAEMAFTSHLSGIHTTPREEVAEGNAKKIVYEPAIALIEDDKEELSNWKDTIEVVVSELESAGVSKKYRLPLATYLHAAYLCNVPLLLAGPNAAEIADAYAAGATGTAAATVNLSDHYDPMALNEIMKDGTPVMKVRRVFEENLTVRIPDIIKDNTNYCYFIHPFSEDIRIEPGSLYAYVLPLFTEAFVVKKPEGSIMGGQPLENYKELNVSEIKTGSIVTIKGMALPSLIKNRIILVTSVMNYMLKQLKHDFQESDYTVFFGQMPYAYATMQAEKVVKTIKEADSRKPLVSKGISDTLLKLYGADYEEV